MLAIVSDIHGNLEALVAVLQDLGLHGADAIYCLGDTVGYGPNPCECLDLAMQWQLTLLGNHDQAALIGPRYFGGVLAARRAILWTQRQLHAPSPDRRAAQRRWDFLARLPVTHSRDGCLFVHGSPRNPVHEYVFPEDVYNPRKMGRIFACVGRSCSVGHTHVPGVFTEGGTFHSPEEAGGVYRLGGTKALVNVGSVGQPRDGDWRACYALLDGDAVIFRRVEYDVDATVRKIRDIDDLDDYLGDRLLEGR
jgi:diadenosine tetraphosphatase ApaH/serine/threonine PP2A family protein phosphatase